ncbi:MAG TPA: flavin reductase family protein [Acidimicrobiales bacterium]|jgi:flavin reductase (DIM6/NTAB) family NADH-FMN oxidoreductase RutF|nr:flavin reductase family protein [Acidimicrobiales bacterium]
MADDLEDFHAFVGALEYPMFIVTAAAAAERDGCLVGFATQCSIHPPRFLACLSVKNRTFRIARRATVLAVHLVGADQHDLAELFGGKTADEVDKLAEWPWREGPDGVPLLDGVANLFVGRVLERVDLGDHVGHLLEPVAARHEGEVDGLGSQEAADIEAGHPA